MSNINPEDIADDGDEDFGPPRNRAAPAAAGATGVPDDPSPLSKPPGTELYATSAFFSRPKKPVRSPRIVMARCQILTPRTSQMTGMRTLVPRAIGLRLLCAGSLRCDED
jgi:hypothetical protein